MYANTEKSVVKEIRTLGNVYVLEEGKEKCCIGKLDESWIWHKILGHLSHMAITLNPLNDPILRKKLVHITLAF